jgi:3-phenylpropionate/trans-cinnamate dioxygenase ferredoxin reductase subunit
MPDYTYLIVGGGMAADAAVRGIRQVDSSGTIGVITSERHPPYDRPPLSKALWKGEPLDRIWRRTPAEKVSMHLSHTATALDPRKKTVMDESGRTFSYGKLLLATGGTVRKFPYYVEGMLYYRTLDDYQRLKLLTEHGRRFAVIGGGFIGSEIAAALAMTKKSVTLIFPGDGIGTRVYPAGLSRFMNSMFQSNGVDIAARENVAAIERRNPGYLVRTTGGREFSVDGVVAGIGVTPNVGLAQSAGLAVDNGILVGEFLNTSHPDIYAAGDVANFYNTALGTRTRVEHEDNANMMGEIAGKNMAGVPTPYCHLPFFYSDLFELGYEAVGDMDSRYELVEDWKEEDREGIVYYLHEGRVRGVLLWNTWGQVEAARRLIVEKGPFNAFTVKGRLPA